MSQQTTSDATRRLITELLLTSRVERLGGTGDQQPFESATVTEEFMQNLLSQLKLDKHANMKNQ